MPLSDIITLPNKNLRKKSSRVSDFEDLRNLISKMEDATLDWEASRQHEVGVALAAIQIDSMKKVVIIRNDFDNKDDKTFQVFINPEIIKYEGTIEEDYEGCLSIPDIYGKVPRYSKVRVKAISTDGKEIRLRASGFLARVFQHEIDHTNGIVFIDHIKNNPQSFFVLKDDGKLEPLDYENTIKDNKNLW